MLNDYKEIPSHALVKGCALEFGVDFEKLNGCASEDHGSNGLELLRKSAERSRDAGVEKSCTVSAYSSDRVLFQHNFVLLTAYLNVGTLLGISKADEVDFHAQVRLNNKIWCIRDGGEWKGCSDGSKPKDLIKAVNKLYNNSNSDNGSDDDGEGDGSDDEGKEL